jgi:hypothetical protein
VQFEHISPLPPHALSSKPPWQVPEASQQPLQVALHGQVPPPRLTVVTHWFVALQHPSGQLLGPQVNPPSHCWLVHDAIAEHVWQSCPSKPQFAVVLPVWQTPCESQQPKQVFSLQAVVTQMPLSHCCRPLHCVHELPPLPQSLVTLPGWHAPLKSQQPVGQVLALQTEPWH